MNDQVKEIIRKTVFQMLEDSTSARNIRKMAEKHKGKIHFGSLGIAVILVHGLRGFHGKAFENPFFSVKSVYQKGLITAIPNEPSFCPHSLSYCWRYFAGLEH